MSRMVVILFSDFPATSTFRAAREENRDSPRIVTLGTLPSKRGSSRDPLEDYLDPERAGWADRPPSP